MNNDVAILGMDAHYGPWDSLEAFARAVYTGQTLAVARQTPLSTVELALRVADNALCDADVARGARVSVFVCAAAGAQIARQIAELWRFSGAQTGFPEQEATVFTALRQAQQTLAAGDAAAVVLVAVDAAGAGALVLTRADAVHAERVYALIVAGIPAAHVALLVSNTPALPDTLLDAYRTPGADLSCALSHGAPSALASLIKTTLSLHRRTLPAFPAWEGPQDPARWQDTPFYVAPESRAWFRDPGIEKRYAALHYRDRDGAETQLFLAEASPWRDDQRVHTQLGETAFYLLPLAADSRESLLADLEALRQRLETATDLDALAQQTLAAAAARATARYALALVGHDRDELLNELSFAGDGVAKAFEQGHPWSTPRGSYFTAQPLGGEGVAFVYPGAFNSYLNLGRDLLQHFPELHESLANFISNPGRAVADRLLYPRSLYPLNEATLSERAVALASNPIALIESGMTFAMLYTRLIRDTFGVQPRSALGYSLGEISMLWAAGVWNSGDTISEAWHRSPLFKTRLFGPKEAVREYWNLETEEDDFWGSYILKAPVEQVREQLAQEDRVYLTIVNLPNEVVIAGDATGCRRVIDALGCPQLRVPFDAVIHNVAMHAEYETFVKLHTHPIHHQPNVTFYSAAGYEPLTLESAAMARAIATMSCQPVDFPRLVHTAYAGGARIFVELGPLGTCSRWIRRILRGKEHAVVSINRSNADDFKGILAVLALLLSHRVPVNLLPLIQPVEQQKSVTLLPTIETVAVEEEREPVQMPATQQDGALSQSAVAPPVPFASALDIYYESLNQHTARVAEGHQAFLATRAAALQQTAELIRLQVTTAGQMLGVQTSLARPAWRKSALFDETAIRAFANGDTEACFGAAYAIYRGRRMPRLPNGDLLLVDRVLEIDGEPNRVMPGVALVSEYDVPHDAWFYRDDTVAALPYAVLMEIALQPCGFLSAYLGSTLAHPDDDFYFRNLDGEGRLLRRINVRGKTITNRTRLLSSTAVRGIIIQEFDFELACEGEPFYRGVSSFGYFTPETLANQAGLDKGQSSQPWFRQTNARGERVACTARGPLHFLNQVHVSAAGGLHNRGYVHGEAQVRPDDWFFKAHFYQDPVMPGSLGVAAIQEALQRYALHQGLARHLRSARVEPAPDVQTTWRYRGQITPENDAFHLEVHVSDVQTAPDAVTLIGDASLWKDTLRIYEVLNVAICLTDTYRPLEE